MTKINKFELNKNESQDFTRVTFYPDLRKFKMEKLDADIVALFTRRAYDIAATLPGVDVYLNSCKLHVRWKIVEIEGLYG